MKIAVVGSGISGLSAAYYLSKKHHVDIFEREDHFGGHSHTIDLFFGEKKVSVDNTNFEYCGKVLSGIFSNKSNLFNIEFLKMFFDIIKFYKKSDQIYNLNEKLTLGE